MARIDDWKTVPYKLSSVGSISATTTTTDFLYLVLIYCCYLLSSSVESLQTREFGGTHYGKKSKEKKNRTGSSANDILDTYTRYTYPHGEGQTASCLDCKYCSIPPKRIDCRYVYIIYQSLVPSSFLSPCQLREWLVVIQYNE